MIFDIRIELGDLQGNIAKFEAEQKRILSELIKKESKKAASEMQKRIPKGNKNSIETKQRKEKCGAGATITHRKPGGSSGHLYAYGTRERVTKKGANRGKTPEHILGEAERKAQQNFEEAVRREMLGLDVDL